MYRFVAFACSILLLVSFAPVCADENAQRLLFSRQQNRQDDLYSVGLDGGAPTRITNHRAKDSHGVLSPDGSKIVFNSERNGWWKIWLMEADGSDPHQLTSPQSGADYYPEWSPDGQRIVYVSGERGNGDLIIMGADASDPINLTDHPARDNFPAWSPDGSRIAFASDRGERWGIYVIDVATKKVTQVASAPDALEPAWFPDSQQLVYQSNATGSFDLYVTKVGSRATPRRLTAASGDEKRPVVSGDGKWIAFESNRGNGSHIWVIDVDGKGERQLTDEGYNYGPRWFPTPARKP